VLWWLKPCGHRYVVRVVASESSTDVVWMSPSGSSDGSRMLLMGEFAEIMTNKASDPLLVTCSKPCLVALYNTGTIQLPRWWRIYSGGMESAENDTWKYLSGVYAFCSWTVLPRDAMRKRGLCCRPVSVRLSCSGIVSRRLKISSNFFLGPVTHHSSFVNPSTATQFQGEPLQQGAKYTGWEKFAIFNWNRRLSIEAVRDRPMVAMKRS